MNLMSQYRLKSNPIYIKFLRENSDWYKLLNRNSSNFSMFDTDMKYIYKMTVKDKLVRLNSNIDKISQIIDIFS